MTTDATSSAPPAGLRESKKQETRQLISDVATGLFLTQGFERTTIAEIAAAARVAKKTVTNYFPRKEDLALDHQDAFTASLARTVTGRRVGESALSALRRAFLDAATDADPVAGFSGPDFARMVADSPTLSARLRDLHDLREAALADALADAVGASRGDITPAPPPPFSAPYTAPCSSGSRNSPSPARTTPGSPPRSSWRRTPPSACWNPRSPTTPWREPRVTRRCSGTARTLAAHVIHRNGHTSRGVLDPCRRRHMGPVPCTRRYVS